MKPFLLSAQFVLFILFGFFLYLFLVEITSSKSVFSSFNHYTPTYNGYEQYDPSLARLSSMKDLRNYCDSLYEAKIVADPSAKLKEDTYPLIAADVVRNRFFHGYSSYGMNNNFMSLMLEPLTGKWMSAIVIPDDIMKYPYAACSQQSIVMMNLLQGKGFTTRKVAFNNGKENGHFAFEVNYAGGWHFFDTNLEPDRSVLIARNNPDIATIVNDKELLLSAYTHLPAEKTLAIFQKFSRGTPNTFPAPNGIIYQRTTKVLSYTTWIFFLATFLLVRRKYLQLSNQYVWNSRIYFPGFKRKGTPSYYPEYEASRA